MISNKSLFALLEEMGDEGFVSKMRNSDACEACHLYYPQLDLQVLSIDCPRSSKDRNEAMLREHDESIILYRHNFDLGHSLGRSMSNKYNGKPTDDIDKWQQQRLIENSVHDIFCIVTNSESKPLSEFADISEVKEFIIAQSEFVNKTIATITEAKLEAEISVL